MPGEEAVLPINSQLYKYHCFLFSFLRLIAIHTSLMTIICSAAGLHGESPRGPSRGTNRPVTCYAKHVREGITPG